MTSPTILATIVAVATALGFVIGRAPADASRAHATTLPLDAPASAADAAEIERLVAGLSDDDWKVRKKSREALIAFGNDALPRVQRLLNESEDADVLTAAKEITEGIRAARETGPSLITLAVNDAHPKDVLDAIAKQADTELRLWPPRMWELIDFREKKRVTLSVKRQPYWVVMKDVLRDSNLRLQEMGERGMCLMEGQDPQTAGPSVVHGPFMIVATAANESKSVRYGREKKDDTVSASLAVNLMVFAEPKLRVIARSNVATVDEAVDDTGHSLIPANPFRGVRAREHMSYGGGGQEHQFSVNVVLSRAPGMTKTIATLKGSIALVLQTRRETLEVADLMKAKGTTHTVAGRQITIDDAETVAPNQFRFKLTVSRAQPAAGPNNWQHRVGVEAYRLRFLDGQGRTIDNRSSSWTGSGDRYHGEITAHIDGDDIGPPAKLVVEVPVEAEDVDVPFEFKDLAVP